MWHEDKFSLSCPLVILSSNTSWYLYNFRKGTISALVNQGFRVICLSPTDRYAARLVSDLGAEHIELPLDGKGVSLLRELCSLYCIWKTMLRQKPDYVFNFTVKMNIYCGLVCSLQKVPFANNISGLGTVFIHDSWLFRRVRKLYGIVNRRAEHLFFQNEDDLDTLRDASLLGDTPVTLLPGSGVNLDQFRSSPLPSDGPVTFLFIGRLLADKGVREYAAAAAILRERGVASRCLLLGPLGASNLTAISEEEVTSWHMKGIIEYLGEAEDVRPYIEKAHVLVLPSYREGMPRTVLEAAAMGRPAIVTDVPGCSHAIEPELTGWLCEVRSAESLAEQMCRLVVMDPKERQIAGCAARRRMEEKFSESLVVQAYLSCLSGREW